jgi:arsenite/tail-anchored protein-transporting ATPase
VMGALRPVARRLTSLPLPDDNVYAAVRRFYDRLEGVRRVLTAGDTTSVRLVVNPEKMVIAEAQRTYTYLNLFGYRVDAIVANRLLPDAVSDPYFDRWKELQARHMRTIHESFAPVPILVARLREQELVGVELLDGLGAEVYGADDPAAVLYADDPMSIEKTRDSYELALKLPFATRDEVELSVKGDELFVKVGPYRRTIMMPKVLASRELSSAQMREDRLHISFDRRTS